MRPTRPVLRYHGGKWLLAPWIIEHFPAHRVYTEAFGGAASVLLRKARSYAEVYNDLDGEVVNLFRVLRDPQQAAELEEQVRLTPYSRAEFEGAYRSCDHPVEQARRTLIPLVRGLRIGGGERPQDRLPIQRDASGHDARRRLGSVPRMHPRVHGTAPRRGRGESSCDTGARAVRRTRDPLHYVDPPYPHSTRMETAKWDRIYRHEMSDDAHRGLAPLLRSLSGMVIVSGYPCELYDAELFPDWTRLERGHMADAAAPRTEVLWLNPAAASRLGQGVLPLESA